jgi:hypothetical protein
MLTFQSILLKWKHAQLRAMAAHLFRKTRTCTKTENNKMALAFIFKLNKQGVSMLVRYTLEDFWSSGINSGIGWFYCKRIVLIQT